MTICYFSQQNDIDNNGNTVDFLNITDQVGYFKENSIQLDLNFKGDAFLKTLTIEKPLSFFNNFNYLTFNNGTKNLFFFINSKRVKNDSITVISLEIDYIQTYLFDIKIKESMVDRCHSPRWQQNGLPVINLEPEVESTGEHEIHNIVPICKLNKTYIISSLAPLGQLKQGGYFPPADSGGGGNGNFNEGVISSHGFRFIKGYEGFAKESYPDPVGINTIGYGVAEHAQKVLYDQLVSEQPISEERGAKIMFELFISDYGRKIVDSCVKMGITEQYQFDALGSLAYNSGNGSITDVNNLTTAIKLDPLNETRIRPIWENFKTNGGMAGLVARRKDECNMFFNKSFEMRSIATIDKNGKINGTVTENGGNGWLP